MTICINLHKAAYICFICLNIVFLNLCTYLGSAEAIFVKVGHVTHLHKVAYIHFYLFKHIFLDIFTYFGSAEGFFQTKK